MKYIKDKQLYKAVMFAIKLSDSCFSNASKAVKTASNYYNIDANKICPYLREKMLDVAKEEKEKTLFFNCTEITHVFGYWAICCPKCEQIVGVRDNSFEIEQAKKCMCNCKF